MSDNTVHCVTGDTVRMLGHWLYVRKCVIPDVVDKATGKLLLELPMFAKDFAEQPWAWAELLAKGSLIGKPATGNYWKLRKARGYVRCLPDEMQVGDLLLIPNQPWRFMHSPYAPTKGIDFFVDETVPVCIYRKEEAA